MNAINVIAPYRYLDMWVFDDPRVGLSAEPFVGGADTMIDQITAHLPNAEDGFVMVFSAHPFPGSDYRLEWLREERAEMSIILPISKPRVGYVPPCYAISMGHRTRFTFRSNPRNRSWRNVRSLSNSRHLYAAQRPSKSTITPNRKAAPTAPRRQ